MAATTKSRNVCRGSNGAKPTAPATHLVMIGRPVCPGAGVGFAPKSLSDLPQDFQDVQVLARCPSQQAAVDQAVTFNASMMQLDRFLDSQVPAWAFVILPLPAGRAATRKANHHD